jgi:hypothetical protein
MWSDAMLSEGALLPDDIAFGAALLIAPPDMLSAARAELAAIMSVAIEAASRLRKVMDVSRIERLTAKCRVRGTIRPAGPRRYRDRRKF